MAHVPARLGGGPLRVALACPYGWDAPGGVQVHVRQLARRLRDRGHDVLVVSPARSHPDEPYVTAVGRPVGIPFNGSVAPVCLSLSSARRIRRALTSFGPDVVHVHEPLIPGTGMFATLAAPAPVVGTFHAYAERSVAFSALAPALSPLWRRLAARVAVSRAAASFVGSRFGGDAIRIIPNGAEVEVFSTALPAELPPGRALLFVNRLEPRKGFRVLVEAFRRLASRREDVRLVVAGDGPQRAAGAALPAALRERVHMLGRVPHAELPSYHAAAEIFCAPATGRESFGIVLVEAMAAGLPVVASDIAGYREVVRDGDEGILVPPGDPGALAGAIDALLEDRPRARALGAAGRERARRFAWDRIAAEIEEVYLEVAGKEVSPGT